MYEGVGKGLTFLLQITCSIYSPYSLAPSSKAIQVEWGRTKPTLTSPIATVLGRLKILDN